jgi:hypothetical protein
MYEFAWRSPQFGGRLGAAHGVETPFVFDTLGLGTEPLLGRDPPQSLADMMHAAWVAFAVAGSCGWPKYDLAHRSTMHFDTASRVVDDPLARSSPYGTACVRHTGTKNEVRYLSGSAIPRPSHLRSATPKVGQHVPARLSLHTARGVVLERRRYGQTYWAATSPEQAARCSGFQVSGRSISTRRHCAGRHRSA